MCKSLTPDVSVEIRDELVAGPDSDVPCRHNVQAHEDVEVDEHGDIVWQILQLEHWEEIDYAIDADKDRTASTDDERFPPPIVVLVAQLHIGGNAGRERDHDDEHDHVNKEVAEHGIHFELRHNLN